MTEFAKAVSNSEEFLVCTALLPAIRTRYGKAFDLLEIPEVLRSDSQIGPHGTVYFRNYEGEKYNDRWNESNGGSGLGTELSSEMVRLIGDFQRIELDWLLALPTVGDIVRQSAFNIVGWLASFDQQKPQAMGIGISINEFDRAKDFIESGLQSACRIVSNGDFYPRNLIKSGGRVVVVDWGHWSGYRACFVDYLVNVAAFAFVHMWGNVEWQREFIHQLGATLNIRLDDFRRAVCIKAFEQARFWQGTPDLAQIQVHQFRVALRNQLWAELWK